MGYPTRRWITVATVHKLVYCRHHILMAKGAGARQSTKGSSFGSGAASQGELQQQGPDDGGVLPVVARALLGTSGRRGIILWGVASSRSSLQ